MGYADVLGLAGSTAIRYLEPVVSTNCQDCLAEYLVVGEWDLCALIRAVRALANVMSVALIRQFGWTLLFEIALS